jgi:hypothetical protein
MDMVTTFHLLLDALEGSSIWFCTPVARRRDSSLALRAHLRQLEKTSHFVCLADVDSNFGFNWATWSLRGPVRNICLKYCWDTNKRAQQGTPPSTGLWDCKCIEASCDPLPSQTLGTLQACPFDCSQQRLRRAVPQKDSGTIHCRQVLSCSLALTVGWAWEFTETVKPTYKSWALVEALGLVCSRLGVWEDHAQGAGRRLGHGEPVLKQGRSGLGHFVLYQRNSKTQAFERAGTWKWCRLNLNWGCRKDGLWFWFETISKTNIFPYFEK